MTKIDRESRRVSRGFIRKGIAPGRGNSPLAISHLETEASEFSSGFQKHKSARVGFNIDSI